MLSIHNRIIVLLTFLLIFNTSAFANDSDVVNCNKSWKIAILGSSTAFGTGATTYDSSWVGKFTSYIKRRNSQNTIYNLAIPGFTTYQNLRPTGYTSPAGRPSPDAAYNITAALALFPDAIIINMPSNDAANLYSLAEQQDNFEAALSLANAANIPVWVTTTQPRNNMSVDQISNLTAQRDWILTRFGNKAVDFWSNVSNPDGSIAAFYDFDNVHVNNEGHSLFFSRMAAENILDTLCYRFTGTLVARAGTDKAVILPANSVTLDGSFSSSSGNITSFSWSKISGPTTFLIQSPNSAITNVDNLIEGRYAFELTVTDDNLITKTDTLNVVVSSRVLFDVGPTTTISPDASGKYWNNFADGLPGIKVQNAITTANLPTTIGFEIVNRIDGTFNTGGPGTNTGNTAGAIGDYGPDATTDFAFAHPSATNGQWKVTGLESNKQYTIKFWGTRSVNDERIIEIKRADQGFWQEYDAMENTDFSRAAAFTFSGKTEMTFDIRVKTGSAFGHICVVDITRTSIPAIGNLPPVARAGNDITITLPNSSAQLNGTASTDDDGNIVTYEWTKVAGPASFNIVSPNSAITDIDNLIEGTYYFELKVTDNESATAVDTVIITVGSRVLFDIGNTATTSPDAGGKYWNNVEDGLPGIKVSNAISTGNTPTGISLEIINRIDGTFNIAGPGVNTGNTIGDVNDYPNSATTDFAFAHPSATNGQWKIGGLDINREYTIKFWGTRSVADQRIIEIRRADETTWKSYDATNNNDYNRAAVFTFTGKTEMLFDIRVEANSAFGHISVVDIRSNEPLCIPVTPSVSISANPGNTICNGTSVTFTATPTNGGTNPTYQWFNGVNPIAGEVSNTYTSSSLINGDAISVQLTSNAECTTVNPVFSNSISMIVNANLPVSVSIDANSESTICEGKPVTFTATLTNGGSNPAYQWYNGNNPISGEISNTYSSNTLANGDIILVQLTSNEVCATGNPANSNAIIMTVNPNLPVSVSIAANPGNTICDGTSVTFTATPTNGGSNPAYQWFNGANPIEGQTTNTFTTSTLSNGDVITVQLTSNEVCTSGNPATSNAITMTVNPNLPVSVSIAANPGNTICNGTSLTFTATPTNGGSNPAYQWFNGVNPIEGQTTNTFTTSTLSNGDVITVQLTSNEVCATGNPAISNAITMTVNPNLPVSVSIAANPGNTICDGTSVTFTATPTNGGSNPTYQWFNGANPIEGQTTDTYTTATLSNGDVITVQLTSNEVCTTGNPATSNAITMTVNPNLPVRVSIAANPGNSICIGASVTFTATPTNGGSNPTYQWRKNGTDIQGETGVSYTTSDLANNDIISCVLTSDIACTANPVASSNNVTIIARTGGSSLTTINNCGSYTWNGNTYTTSGTYTYTITNPDGCDSIATLNLTILNFTVGALTGPSNVCAHMGPNATIATYTLNVTDASSIEWRVPATATILSGIGTNTITLTLSSSFGSGVIIATANNPCGSPETRSIILTRATPAIPTAILGPVNICSFAGTSQVATYSINAVPEAISYRWTLPPNATIINASNDSTSIDVRFDQAFLTNTNKTITVSSTSGCGNSGTRALTLVTPIPTTPVPISGPTNACIYIDAATTATYSIRKVNTATSYIWQVPDGVSIVAHPAGLGVNDTIISVSFNNNFISGTNISVSAATECGSSAIRSLSIIRNAAFTPGTITGPSNVCAFTGNDISVTYSIPSGNNATFYNWVLPPGVVATHPAGTGINDTIIEVVFPPNYVTGIISVAAGNGCSISVPRVLTVQKISPKTPSLVGPTDPCPFIGASPATYSIRKIAEATGYNWSIPAIGATVVHQNPAGPNDTLIFVTYNTNFTTGSISVSAFNQCATSRISSINLVRRTTFTPGLISSTVISSTCPVRRYSYAISSLPSNATGVIWTVPAGAVIDSGQGSLRIFVTYSSNALSNALVTVSGFNNCGSSSPRVFPVSLPACPAPFAKINTPGNQLNTEDLYELKSMPNPTNNYFVLTFKSTDFQIPAMLRVSDINGHIIDTKKNILPGQPIIVGSNYKNGIYIAEFIQGKKRKSIKLFKL